MVSKTPEQANGSFSSVPLISFLLFISLRLTLPLSPPSLSVSSSPSHLYLHLSPSLTLSRCKGRG